MTSRSVFVSAQLCFIIQVAFILSALGSDGQSYGSSSPIQEQMLLKRSIQSQGLLKLGSVPELVNLTLLESNIGITAKWSLKDPTSSPGVRFRVTTAGVDKIVSQNSYTISGLACKTSYDIKVSPVDAAGADYGVSTNATIMTKGALEPVNLTLQATHNEITARWSVKDPKCFPDAWFQISTPGGYKLGTKNFNSYTITGLTCNTSYFVQVIPYASPILGGVVNGKIVTKGVPELFNLVLRATLHGITASWLMKDPKCFPNPRFRITTAGVDKIVSQNSYDISGLACMTSYFVKVSPVDAAGADYGDSTNATIKTTAFPELVNITLQETLNVVTVRWSLVDPQCFPYLRFRVISRYANPIVSQNSYNITQLTCNTSSFVWVGAVDANGAPYGSGITTFFIMKGVPEVYPLILKASDDVIGVTWSLKDKRCLPGVRFRVTTAGVDKIVNETSFKISGLRTCNISYNVNVSPVDANGTSFGLSASATVISAGVPQLFNLTLTEANNEITVKWSLKDPKCFPNVRFRVTTAGVDRLVLQNSLNIIGIACNTSYFVKVSPFGLDSVTYGDSTNATILAKGVPEVGNLVLSSTLKGIRATWSLKNTKCFPDVWFRVTTAGVDKIVSQNSYDISGLACNTGYNVKVSPVNATGAPYGVPTNATIATKGVPEVIDLILKATNNEITVRWALRDPTCFLNVMFRVTSAGVNKTVWQNTFVVISGLACDTSYVVKVSPIDAAGADYGFARETSIITLGMQVTLRAMVAESLIVKWAPVQGSCKYISTYEVTLSLPNGAYKNKILTTTTHFVFAGLNSSTAYRVQVQPLDASGRVIGRALTAQGTTLHIDTAAGRCPYPTLVVAVWSGAIMCATVQKPTPSTNLEANKACYNKHPATPEFKYMAMLYLAAKGWGQFGYLQEYLRMFDYTGKFLVNGYYKNGAWVWGFGTNYDDTYPIDPALVSGLSKGGNGPNDNKMLYIDSANDFALRTAKDGYPFDGMICAFPVKV